MVVLASDGDVGKLWSADAEPGTVRTDRGRSAAETQGLQYAAVILLQLKFVVLNCKNHASTIPKGFCFLGTKPNLWWPQNISQLKQQLRNLESTLCTC